MSCISTVLSVVIGEELSGASSYAANQKREQMGASQQGMTEEVERLKMEDTTDTSEDELSK